MRNGSFFLAMVYLAALLAGCPTANVAPVSDAGPDQSVTLGATVTLDGRASSDANGDTLTYQWQFQSRPTGSSTTLNGAGSAQPTFVPDLPGSYVLALTVFDGQSSSSASTVTITVTGSLVVVPDLSGQTEEEARTALVAVGLTVGTVSMASSPTVPVGQVLSQDPAALTSQSPGSSVDIVISTGPASVTVPNVVGQSRSTAESTLENAGLAVGTITTQESATIPSGEVLSQSVAPDTVVDEGTAVDLVISAGMPVAIALQERFELRTLLNDAGDGNVLRPALAASRPGTALVYITALLTPHVAIYDTDSGSVTGSLDSGFTRSGEKIPVFSPDGTTLYIADRASGILARMDAADGQVTATTAIPGTVIDLAATNSTVFLAVDASPGLRFLDGDTLAETGSTDTLDNRLGPMHLDGDSNTLRILDASPADLNGMVSVLDAASQTVTGSVSFSAQGPAPFMGLKLDVDVANDRFFVLGPNGLAVYRLDGSSPRFLPRPSTAVLIDMVYVPGTLATQRLVALGLSQPTGNEVSALGARLYAYNPNTGQITSPVESLELGEANAVVVRNAMTDHLVSPDHATGILWGTPASPFTTTATEMPVGVHTDKLAVHNDGLFGIQRYRGNLLFRLALDGGTLSTTTTGRWPAALRVDTAADEVVALNAWDSTVETFSTDSTPVSAGTVGSGFDPGTTERLPALTLSPDGGTMAVVYPEFGVVRVRTRAGEDVATLDVPDAMLGSGESSQGTLQVAFHPGGAGPFYLFDRDTAQLHRYDTEDDYAFLGTTDLSEALASQADAPPTDWVYFDSDGSRMYVGPVQLAPSSGSVTGDPVPAGQVIRGRDLERDLYWTVSQEAGEGGFTVTIHTVHRADNTTAEAELVLDGTHPIAPVFAFDTENRRFVIGYPATGTIEAYDY